MVPSYVNVTWCQAPSLGANVLDNVVGVAPQVHAASEPTLWIPSLIPLLPPSPSATVSCTVAVDPNFTQALMVSAPLAAGRLVGGDAVRWA